MLFGRKVNRTGSWCLIIYGVSAVPQAEPVAGEKVPNSPKHPETSQFLSGMVMEKSGR